MTRENLDQRYLCKYYYIGSKRYHGSQRQIDLLTVEDCIISALEKTNYIKNFDSSKIDFASRTDRFVSARGATFSFVTRKKLTLMEINSTLPKDMGLWAYSKVPLNFSSRFKAKLRHYRYIFPKSITTLKDLNFALVKEACNKLEGHHDFANFCKRESDQENTIRDLEIASVRITNQYIIFDFMSKGFLRQQIRRMVKMIMEVGLQRLELKDFLKLFDTSRTVSYQPVDPTGLLLWDIFYGDDINFKIDNKSLERMKLYFFEQMIKYGLKNQLFLLLQQNDFS